MPVILSDSPSVFPEFCWQLSEGSHGCKGQAGFGNTLDTRLTIRLINGMSKGEHQNKV